MNRDFLPADKTLHTHNSHLSWGIRSDGVFAVQYFSFADIYCSYYVQLYEDDVKTIQHFLKNWGSEKVRIIQPYKCTVNGKPSYCALDLEYVEVPDAPRDMQRIGFYCQCWGKDVESSLEEDEITAWSTWDDYYFWDEFESFRTYIDCLCNHFDNLKEASE